jgi:hypothetical protein
MLDVFELQEQLVGVAVFAVLRLRLWPRAALPSVIGGPDLDFTRGVAFPDAVLAPGRVPRVSAVVPVAAGAGLPATSRECRATAGYASTGGTGRLR